MEKNDTNDQLNEPEVKEQITPASKPRAKSRNITINRTVLIACGATAIVALLIGTTIGLVLGKNGQLDDDRSRMIRPLQSNGMMDGLQQNAFRHQGGDGQSQQSNRLTGVVTAVNGSTLTVAGNGSAHSVTTNSSTQWLGNISAAVNDTVMIEYSGSGSDLTALSIRVIGASATSGNSSLQSTSANNT